MTKKKTEAKTTWFRGMQLIEQHDAFNHAIGLIAQPRQVTTTLTATRDLDSTEVSAWLEELTQIDGLSVAAVQENFGTAMPARAILSFRRPKKSKIKDKEFAEHVALAMPTLLTEFWSVDDATTIASRISEQWTGIADQNFPPRVVSFQDKKHFQSTHPSVDIIASTFEMRIDHLEFVEELRRVLAALGLPITMTHVSRIDSEHEKIDGLMLTIMATTKQDNDAIVRHLFSQLSPLLRIRLSRMWHRQHLGFLVATGLPAWGFQLATASQFALR